MTQAIFKLLAIIFGILTIAFLIIAIVCVKAVFIPVVWLTSLFFALCSIFYYQSENA